MKEFDAEITEKEFIDLLDDEEVFNEHLEKNAITKVISENKKSVVLLSQKEYQRMQEVISKNY